jgi:hypothetical protein
MKAEQCLTASYDWSDEPLHIEEIDGLAAAVERVRETKEKELVRCDDRVADYDVYWNTKTDAVRIAAVVTGATYEVTDETSLSDYE